MGYTVVDVDPQLQAQLEKLLGELRNAAKEQISRAERRNLILLAQKADEVRERIWKLIS